MNILSKKFVGTILLTSSTIILASCSGSSGQSTPPSAPSNNITNTTAAPAAPESAPATESSTSESSSTDNASTDNYVGDYDSTFGKFKAKTVKGQGDDVISLPDVKGMLVTMTNRGSSNFIVTATTKKNKDGEGVANEIGNFKGTVFLMTTDKYSDDIYSKLKIKSDGNWTVTFSPVSTAPKLMKQAKGHGPAVLLYDNASADYKVTHNGESNFIVSAYDGGVDGINEIGKYSGIFPMTDGPNVVSIQADGDWSFVRR